MAAAASAAPAPATAPAPDPSYAPYASIDAEKRAHLSVKLRERVCEALNIVYNFGHRMKCIVVLDLDRKEDFVSRCIVCDGSVVVKMGEFADPPFTGTATAFTCRQLERGRKG